MLRFRYGGAGGEMLFVQAGDLVTLKVAKPGKSPRGETNEDQTRPKCRWGCRVEISRSHERKTNARCDWAGRTDSGSSS